MSYNNIIKSYKHNQNNTESHIENRRKSNNNKLEKSQLRRNNQIGNHQDYSRSKLIQ